ncbi:MAG: phosphomannomutase/phosphoglucomutase [Synergistaceae bacterium]|nr:phosphomannomutase/phosphoglucomutase [Synergistaceae bacterium]
MAMIPEHIFREYDIRGIAETELTDETVRLIGQAYGTWLSARGIKSVTLGGDARLSTKRIKAAAADGMMNAGVNVTDIGLVSTPAFYWSMYRFDVTGGIMVTGSHNPKEFNGLKVAYDKTTLWGDGILEFLKIIQEGRIITADISGSLRVADINLEYIDMLVSKIELGPRRPKIVCDSGNGTGGLYAPMFLRRIGCDVTELFSEPDGTFPNHHPDPTKRENLTRLIETVCNEKADFGVGFDGDADRIGVVDDKGEVIWGDRLMALYWREILPKHPGAVAICEVKSSMALPEEILKLGGRPIWWNAGHSLIKAKMREENALFSGEVSGHMFFADEYFGYDDAFYAAARLARIISHTDRPLSEIMAEIPRYPSTAETRYDCPDDVKSGVVERVKAQALKEGLEMITVDGVRIVYKNGWGLIRISNTQPILVARCEGRTEEALADICADMKRRLLEAGSPPFEWEY